MVAMTRRRAPSPARSLPENYSEPPTSPKSLATLQLQYPLVLKQLNNLSEERNELSRLSAKGAILDIAPGASLAAATAPAWASCCSGRSLWGHPPPARRPRAARRARGRSRGSEQGIPDSEHLPDPPCLSGTRWNAFAR